jgi:hypothetical protein
MNTNLLALAAQLSDDALRAKVKLLAQRSREVTVELIAHLAVLEVRKLHCSEGPGSLFRYCTEILRFPRRPLATASKLRGPLGSFL